MKTKVSILLRSIGAIIIGVLLIKYSNNAVLWLTILIGVIFLLSGLVSCITYLTGRNRKGIDDIQILDATGRDITPARPSFPIIGLGSLLLGGLLTFAPSLFINFLVYGLALILILGALNQFFNLSSASRIVKIGLFWWIVPALIFKQKSYFIRQTRPRTALVKPSIIATAPLYIIGWCMIIYGVVEMINSIKISRCRRDYAKAVEIREQQETANSQTAKETDKTPQP